jgi:hypothetical protein
MSCAAESTEEDHHSHSHSHSHHHTHAHGDPPLATTPAHSLYAAIDFPHCAAFNLANPSSELPLLFKDSSHRFDVTPSFSSLYGPDLLLNIFFTGPVKIYSVIIRAHPDAAFAPRTLRFFKNAPQLSMETASTTRPLHIAEHPLGVGPVVPTNETSASITVPDADGQTFVEHHLPRRKFTGTTTLSIHISTSWASEDAENADEDSPTTLYAVEIRGEWAGPSTAMPLGLLYEAAARKEDHPVEQQTAHTNNSIL